ncbi:MAG: thiamine pyrophosphate-dependent enzyme, partial [Myxococcota bacterium]
EADELPLRHLRMRIGRLAARAMGRLGEQGPGPVHVNVPFQEPLEPTVVPGDIPDGLSALALHGRSPEPFVTVLGEGRVQPSLESLNAVASRIAGAQRGLIVCGPCEPTQRVALGRLARVTGFPVLADPISGLRGVVEGACVHYDVTLRPSPWSEATVPDLVLRWGQTPTSKPYRLWRERHLAAGLRVDEIAVAPHGALREQTQQAPMLLIGDPNLVAEGLADRLEAQGFDRGPLAPWMERWRVAEAKAAAVVDAATEGGALWEGQIARDLLAAMPDDGILIAASSMPIRDLDTFAGAPRAGVQIVSNRGVNGIDGLIATTLGAAMATARPTVLLVGDVAFMHDASSLLAARRSLRPDGTMVDATIVVIDNGGGAIFSYLPIAGHPDHFERLFLTPPQVAPEAVAHGYGLKAQRVRDAHALKALLAEPHEGVRVVVVEVERTFNVERHRAVQLQVAKALGEGGDGHG